MKHKNILITLLSIAFSMLVLGCNIVESGDVDTIIDNVGTVIGPVIASTNADTFIKPDGNTITLSFDDAVEAATGVILTKSIKVYPDAIGFPNAAGTIESVTFRSTIAAVTNGNTMTITMNDTKFVLNKKIKVVIPKESLMDSSGNKNASEITTEELSVVNNLADYPFWYKDTILTVIKGNSKTFAPDSSIPAEAKATYAIAARAPTTDIAGITIDADASIIVADTTKTGTYELMFTASTKEPDFAGVKNYEVTVVVVSADATALTTSVTYKDISAKYNTEILKSAAEKPTLSADTETVSYSALGLPTGLQVDSTTGQIYGTPTKATAPNAFASEKQYTVTATGYGDYTGEVKTIVTIEVAAATIPEDANFTYEAISGIADIAMPAAVGPKWTSKPAGIDLAYTIAPTEIGGLTFNASNGEISGTPNAAIDGAEFTITATASGNYTGTKTATFKITITKSTTDATALTGTLSYANVTGIVGTELAAISPTWSVAEQTASYAISPSLEGTGLDFSTTTGEISGTPNAIIKGVEYTVTATGTGNYKESITSNKFTITVTSAELTGSFSYEAISATYNTEISLASAAAPTAKPAEAVAYTVGSKALPAGLQVDGTTGKIYGTPTVVSASEEYTIIATGTATGYIGSTKTATVSIEVAPAELTGSFSYEAITATYNTEISLASAAAPTAKPAEAVAYTVGSKALPAGLQVDGTTGKIYGTPTVVSASEEYTIIATGTATGYIGSTKTATVSIEVAPAELTGSFSYEAISAKHNTEISLASAVAPTAKPAEAVTYTVGSKALPVGLQVDAATGKIYGTPTVVSASEEYTIIATGTATGYEGSTKTATVSIEVVAADTFKITSTSYTDGAEIPVKYSCMLDNISPQYAWANPPSGTTSYALIMDDEVLPCGTGDSACKHWGVFNIPSTTTSLEEGADPTEIAGVIEGLAYDYSDYYSGPCPPSKHTYNTTIYALKSTMPTIAGTDDGPAFTRSQFVRQYGTHILGSATISGTFTPPTGGGGS